MPTQHFFTPHQLSITSYQIHVCGIIVIKRHVYITNNFSQHKIKSYLNRPFAARGRMVETTPYWRAKECARPQNKMKLTRKVWFFFVFHFPVDLLHSSMAYFVPCDLWLQKAYLITITFNTDTQQHPVENLLQTLSEVLKSRVARLHENYQLLKLLTD